ncbi:hypothetical protein EZS27_000678 [termite gut metagenome]|uniref:NigD-like C-terminal beta sandwich domain-containing protein n=1 Tax=termite gut metagenome TaxID=433724 RepID=A0A5J4T0M0_9ZZZZ
MKLVGIFLRVMAIFIGVSFASCLKGNDDDRQYRGVALATVELGYGNTNYLFKLDTGEKLIPTTGINDPTKLSSVKRIFISYYFDSAEEINEQELVTNINEREYHISVISIINLEENVTLLSAHGTTGDSLTTTYYDPIESIDSLRIKDNYLTLWVNYDMSGEKLHFFTLFRYQEDGVKEGKAGEPDTLEVYLGHNSRGDSYYGTTSSNFVYSDMGYAPVYYKAFHLKNVVSELPSGVSSNLALKVISREVSHSSKDTISVSYSVNYFN